MLLGAEALTVTQGLLSAGSADSPAARFAAAQALLCGVAYPTGSKSSVADASTARASLDIRESLVKEQWSSRGSHARDTSPLRCTAQSSPPKNMTSAPSSSSASTAAQVVRLSGSTECAGCKAHGSPGHLSLASLASYHLDSSSLPACSSASL